MSEPKYKLVPVEPDEKQIRAAMDCQDADPQDGPETEFYYQYKAAIAAAPSPPQDPRDEALRVAREALEQLYEDTADYIRINNLGDVHQNKPMRDARDALHTIKELMGRNERHT